MVEELLEAHPRLTREAIQAAPAFAAEVLRADVVSPLEVQPEDSSRLTTFSDSFGKRQDTPSCSEDVALDDLIAHTAFEEATSVFELGCGTSCFALRLRTKPLPPAASYFAAENNCAVRCASVWCATQEVKRQNSNIKIG